MDALDLLDKFSETFISPIARKKLKKGLALIIEALEEEQKVMQELKPLIEKFKIQRENENG